MPPLQNTYWMEKNFWRHKTFVAYVDADHSVAEGLVNEFFKIGGRRLFSVKLFVLF